MVNKKGFTLIELIIVIAVIAILATTVILVLNPVNILAEARDSQRIADLGQLSSALGLYLATVSSPSMGVAANCYAHRTDLGVNCQARHAGKTTTGSVSRVVTGAGWIPVNLSATSGGSPLSVLPIDPRNTTALFYSYLAPTSSTYEINADMESARYGNTGSDDVESTDGGDSATIYEVGNDPGLDGV